MCLDLVLERCNYSCFKLILLLKQHPLYANNKTFRCFQLYYDFGNIRYNDESPDLRVSCSCRVNENITTRERTEEEKNKGTPRACFLISCQRANESENRDEK